MSTHLKMIFAVLGVSFVAIYSSCTKDTTVIIPLSKTISKTVSFSIDLIPLFTANCALSGCHAEGGTKPILAAGKAYKSLMGDPLYIKVKKPEESEFYQKLTGRLAPRMPMGKTPNPSNIEAYVLTWIKQGAKNN